MKKYVYLFSEGNAKMRDLLGGKGANLAEMTGLGLPVPQGFTISTEACTQYYEDGRQINPEIREQIMEYIEKMEQITGKKFGDLENPLLVSVRSGARASMPGMMDTILNLGLNEDVVEVIAKKSGNPRWAWDCYRRFIQMFSDVVMEVGKKYFETLIDRMKEEKGITYDVELTAEDLKELANQFKAEYRKQLGEDFPSDPKVQLFEAIRAVFRSWDNPRANIYRMDHDIPYSWGTAVNVQMMAFGNMGDTSGTGVAFTRNPATGEKGLMGEFLVNAQGEDVVAGVRTPMPIDQMKEVFPEAFAQFNEICNILENHYHDMQDMEFTIENKKLYMLQTRNGKRTAAAAIKIACDLIDEGQISEEEALMQIDAKSLDMLLHPTFDPEALKKADKENVMGKGIAASPGAAAGTIVFTAEDAAAKGKKGEKVILVRLETSPEDIEGMKYAQGILTVRGGQTSHAAVVARGMGTCCVSGCGDIKMDEAAKRFTLAGKTFGEGRIDAFREMICSETTEERERALAKIEPMQQGDFEALFEALDGYPVTIRFLDPPLHEFVPTEEEDIKKLADAQGKSVETIRQLCADLHEFNPMMGHRGCRLAVTFPEIAAMQTRAVIKAALAVKARHADWNIVPEIMIPLAGEIKELKFVKDIVKKTADEVIAQAGVKLAYQVGTMIEVPRAALTADQIAEEAEFFCFGTNDLTQMTFGFSRDDAGKFLTAYYENKIFESDPFTKLDTTGVGMLMEMAMEKGKKTRPTLHAGICGEHGGDPASIEFCHKIGLDYVSCSPYRVPIARLSAAQAAISAKGK